MHACTGRLTALGGLGVPKVHKGAHGLVFRHAATWALEYQAVDDRTILAALFSRLRLEVRIHLTGPNQVLERGMAKVIKG